MVTRSVLLAGIAVALAIGGTAVAGDTPSPEGATAYIISPADGATVSSPVAVVFGLAGMGVAPAGIEKENTGHHHLMIDLAEEEIDFNEPLPAYEQLVHFGGGQTETSVELEPGEHTLRIILGDQNHVPHDPPVMSEPITITVE